MSEAMPEILVISGPNGAGKSTCIIRYLPLGMTSLNADEIAKGLLNYPSVEADMQAGRLVLQQMDDLEKRLEGFAVETTLASRSLASRAARLRKKGYHFHLVYVWSPSPEFSVSRVASRVRSGGHHIPEETIRRRFSAGLKNFFQLYQPLADVWDVLDNTNLSGPYVIASGRLGSVDLIEDRVLWDEIQERGNMSLDGKLVSEPRSTRGTEMIAAMRDGVTKALGDHKIAERSVIIWDRETDRILEIPAVDIVVIEATKVP